MDHDHTSPSHIPTGDLARLPVVDLPRATPSARQATSSIGSDDVDSLGVAFDPAKHEHRKRLSGAWALKRGNGARKAAGMAYNVPRIGSAPESTPPPVAGDPTPQPPAAQAFAPGSSIGAVPHDGGGVVPEVETAPMLTEADYEATGRALANGMFGLAQLTLDHDAWEPTPAESKAFAGAFTRVWMHYSLPRLGPLLELVFLLPPTIAKRANHPRTAKALGWFVGMFRRPTPKTEKSPEPITEPPKPARSGEVMNPNPPSRFKMVG